MSAGHDQFPAAKVRIFAPISSEPYPGVLINSEESYTVVSQPDEAAGADLIVIVARAIDHHGNDVRELVAQRIALGLAQ